MTKNTKMRYRKFIDEPNMSDKTLLVSVEDLICLAFGTIDQNTVNFKLVQTILHILARQMRLLEQDVEIKFDDVAGERISEDEREREDEDHYSSSSSEGGEAAKGGEAAAVGGDREGGERGGARSAKRDKKDRDKTSSKDRDRTDRGASKSRDRGKGSERGGRSAERGGGHREDQEVDREDYHGREGGADRGGERGADRGGEREADRGGERGGPRGGEHGGPRGGEHGGERGGERGGDRGGERRGGKGGERQEDRGGERKEDRGGEGKEDRGGEGKEDRGGERKEDRGGERKGDRGGEHGGSRGGDRGGSKSADRGGERGSDRGGRSGEREAGGKHGPDTGKHGSGVQDRGQGRDGSRTSIIVSEADRKGGTGAQDKILVVEKGPTTRADSRTRVGSIEVVTASQFALLEEAVKELMTITGPVPMPAMPDNEKLRKDLAKGTASLTETMQAMQLNARVQAAEQALSKMAGLLTQLAAAGALPEDVAEQVVALETELHEVAASIAAGTASIGTDTFGTGTAGTGTDSTGTGTRGAASPGAVGAAGATATRGQATSTRKSVVIDPATAMSSRPDSAKAGASDPKGTSTATSRSSVTGRSSMVSAISAAAAAAGGMTAAVTHPELNAALEGLNEELTKQIAAMTAKATTTSENASTVAKSVYDKLDIALSLDKRITMLHLQTADYAEQLSGFDSGLSTQMASFQEQMLQMRNELKGGLTQLEQANNNAETAAITELTEHYESLVIDLDSTVHTHRTLTALQKQLSEELRSLVECVEMLREQKADRDEVFDGLKDKADITRLAGLLQEQDFAIACMELEGRLEMCYDKFRKQDQVWQGALTDLKGVTEGKAEIMELLAIKDNATDELRSIQSTLRKQYELLGEPKAAMLTRMLAQGAVCASCLAPALMSPLDANFGKPFALPVLRVPMLGEEEICIKDPNIPSMVDTRNHVCRRWVGGSHTLMAGNVSRERATGQQMLVTPTKRYAGYGVDGRLYMLEEELQPCLECNKFSTDVQEEALLPSPVDGGGDQGNNQAAAETTGGDKEEQGGRILGVFASVNGGPAGSLISEPLTQRSNYDNYSDVRESMPNIL